MKKVTDKLLLCAGRAFNRTKRMVQRRPSRLIVTDHPVSEHLWDRQKGIRGWVASDVPLQSVVVADDNGAVIEASLELRSDVAFFLRYQFKCHAGFFVSRSVGEWLKKSGEAQIRITCTFEDGELAEHVIVLRDDRVARAEKFKRYRGMLRCPDTGEELVEENGRLVARNTARSYPLIDGIPDFLADDFKKAFCIDHTDNISSWDYDERITEMVVSNPDKLFLDCGAGLRKVCYPNVINYEIVSYSSTDVLGVAEKLPFADNSLDGVISVAVLEHVKDPFQSAAEISRVLKPGGFLFCAVPFLQPLHGYPHHYYNMTAEGIKNLFPGLQVDDVYVPLSLHPIQAIRWILFSYVNGLPEGDRKTFENMRVKDIFVLPQFDAFYRKKIPFIHNLSEAATSEVAAGHCLVARKPLK